MSVIEQKGDIRAFRILVLRSALALETKGLMRSRRPSAYATVRREFGFKGSPLKVLDQLNNWIKENIL